MIFKGISKSESIWFKSPETNIMYRIILSANSPLEFSLGCSHDENWGYSFVTDDPADYERIKYNIMETLFACENEEEILSDLCLMIEDGFADILVKPE